MCGINGFISLNNQTEDEIIEQINSMNDLIIHRGPDSEGVFVERCDNVNLSMGMRRLSIIDLQSGNQPMYSEDKQIIIVFNGEIYNFIDLKNKLKNKGVQFKTTSDTEVILKLYESGGVASFNKLDGMFAFSIYDKTKGKVFILRDFFGEKPLYYTLYKNIFVWGSELKSVIEKINYKPIIDKTGLNLFFRLTYIPAPYTIYEDIFKLESNHYIEIDAHTLKHTIHKVTNEFISKKKENISYSSAKDKVKELLHESVESRSISDVPLGTFLSGGVDSSIISLCLAQSKSTPINTFSIGFEKKSYDETEKSRAVAKQIGSNHHEFIINEKDLKKDIDKILHNFDEPFADSSSLPTFLVSNKTRKHVKVALTGDGGDEVFGGYNKYYAGKMNKKYTNLISPKIHDHILSITSSFLKTKSDHRGFKYQVKRLLDSIDYNEEFYWDIISLGYTKNSLRTYIKEAYFWPFPFQYFKSYINLPVTLTDFRLVDKQISLEGDMLVKVDRTSMLNSLECRAPFLNKKIWDYSNSLPENYLIKGWDKKHILKEAFKDQFPKRFLDKRKSGFGVPVGDWLKSSLRKELISYSEKNKLEKQGIFRINAITDLISKHLRGTDDNSFKIWTFYCFQKWYFGIYENL